MKYIIEHVEPRITNPFLFYKTSDTCEWCGESEETIGVEVTYNPNYKLTLCYHCWSEFHGGDN